MKAKVFTKVLSLLLVLVTLSGIAFPVSAEHINVSDGDNVELYIGQSVVLRNAESGLIVGRDWCSYSWSIDGEEGIIELTENGRLATVKAKKAGTVELVAKLTSSFTEKNTYKVFNAATKQFETRTETVHKRRRYTDRITVTVYNSDEPPIVASLPNSVIVAEGKKAAVTLDAQTHSGTSLRYQWYYANAGSSKFSKASATGKTYSVTMNEDRNGRKIYCVVTDGNGKKTKSETVTLKMAAPVKITSQPKTASVAAGASAKTTVKATGQGKLKYTWYVKDKDDEKFGKSSITTSTYSVKMTPSVHGRKVYCVVSDSYGQKTKTNTVTLKMNDTLGIYSQPSNAEAVAGQQATTTVKARGSGKLTYTWYIKDPGKDKFAKSSITTNTYKVTMKSSNNGRQVYCVVKDSTGKKVTSKTVTLTTVSKLKITTQPKSTKVAEGKDAKVSVKVSGGSGVKYQWYYASAGSSSFSKSSTTTATYSVQMNDKRNGRQVYCVITDNYGQKVKSETVTLKQAKPITIKTQPASVKVLRGKKASATVKATGDGTLKYQWYIKNVGSEKFGKSSVTSATYAVTMKDSVNGRQAYCVISDSYGQKVTTETVTLSQVKDITITTQPVDIYYDDIDSYTCNATGEQPLTFTWYKRTADGEFSVCKVQEDTPYSWYLLPWQLQSTYKGGEVYCVVSDTYGQSVKSRVAKIAETRP